MSPYNCLQICADRKCACVCHVCMNVCVHVHIRICAARWHRPSCTSILVAGRKRLAWPLLPVPEAPVVASDSFVAWACHSQPRGGTEGVEPLRGWTITAVGSHALNPPRVMAQVCLLGRSLCPSQRTERPLPCRNPKPRRGEFPWRWRSGLAVNRPSSFGPGQAGGLPRAGTVDG